LVATVFPTKTHNSLVSIASLGSSVGLIRTTHTPEVFGDVRLIRTTHTPEVFGDVRLIRTTHTPEVFGDVYVYNTAWV
jgi:hypothetical protein